MIKFLGHVNAEGGPLLLGDLECAARWTGAEGSEDDYSRGCALFDAEPDLEGAEISVGDGTALLWEMRGAGTAWVFRGHDNTYIVARTWPHDPSDSGAPQQFASEPVRSHASLGCLNVSSGTLVVMWAAESGLNLSAAEAVVSGRPSEPPSIEDSILIVHSGITRYRCFHDNIVCSVGQARRLRLVPTVE